MNRRIRKPVRKLSESRVRALKRKGLRESYSQYQFDELYQKVNDIDQDLASELEYLDDVKKEAVVGYVNKYWLKYNRDLIGSVEEAIEFVNNDWFIVISKSQDGVGAMADFDMHKKGAMLMNFETYFDYDGWFNDLINGDILDFECCETKNNYVIFEI